MARCRRVAKVVGYGSAHARAPRVRNVHTGAPPLSTGKRVLGSRRVASLGLFSPCAEGRRECAASARHHITLRDWGGAVSDVCVSRILFYVYDRAVHLLV